MSIFSRQSRVGKEKRIQQRDNVLRHLSFFALLISMYITNLLRGKVRDKHITLQAVKKIEMAIPVNKNSFFQRVFVSFVLSPL